MATEWTLACPECGAGNHGNAELCRICGARLHPQRPVAPRVERKYLRRTDFIAAARANERRTWALVIWLLVIALALGYLIGWTTDLMGTPMQANQPQGPAVSVAGLYGAAFMFGIAALWAWVAITRGDRIVLRMTGARRVEPSEEPVLHNVVEEMALAAGLPKPEVYVIETPAMNAFATGMRPDRAVIGVTRGLLQQLNREELQGVVGHEMGHVMNLDMRYATAVGVIVGLIALVCDGALRATRFGRFGRARGRRGRDGAQVVFVLVMLVFLILAPLFARLVQMAVSRQREFLADATSVRLTRHPEGLIQALDKLARSAEPFAGANRATQHMFIVNPFRNFSEKVSALMASHPPIDRRIHRLRNLGA